jgi:phosphoglycerol transferase MdoB-like AlkP superfamily enzyme
VRGALRHGNIRNRILFWGITVGSQLGHIPALVSTSAFPAHLALLLRRLLLVVGAYSAVRVLFWATHPTLFAEASGMDVGAAFVHGLRFDLSAIAYTNVPFILLSLAPAAWQARPLYSALLRAAFLIPNIVAILLMVGDTVYFDFTGTRLTFDLFDLKAEATNQIDQLLLNYAPFTLVAAALIAGLWVLYPRHRTTLAQPRWFVALPATVLVLGCTVLAARGGTQKKPLNPIHAFAGSDHALGVLTLNSVFTLLQSPLTQQITPATFYASDDAAEDVLEAPFGLRTRVTPPQNVVVIILESFATEFWGAAGSTAGLTPFLDSLVPQGRFFAHNFANGRRSIDALPSILLGVPLLMSRSIALSPYQSNEWIGLGHLLGDAGYQTSMFHGAPAGTMYFDAIARMAGVRDFYSMERYPTALRERDFDGHWGLFDEPFLQFAATELSAVPQPFFSTIFTISTHQPFRVPPQLVDSLPAGTAEIHRSVRYVDQSLGRFFATARQQPWFENTLFIITGDHTQSERDPRFDTTLGRYMVPLLLYHPSRPLPPTDPLRITQHVDLLPTILDYTGVTPTEIPRFGRSVFSPAEGEAILGSDGYYWLVRRDGVVQRDAKGTETVFPYAAEASLSASAMGQTAPVTLAGRLQAHLQHFNNSLLRNSFYRADADGPGTPQ